MARSLTVTHEETTSTSPLFTGFLLIAIGVLAMATFVGMPVESAPVPAPAAALP